MRCIVVLLLLSIAFAVGAHPEDEFCVPGEGDIDPELCEALNALQSGSELRPLLDDEGRELGTLATAWRYAGVGIGHILPGGLDHILFVLALFLTSPRLKPLVLQVTMFTLAHSLTLGMAAAGWITPNAAWVEALIAATIAFVAIENLFVRSMPQWRLPVVFLFGLLHGLGFAGFFGELGLPENQFFGGLVGFNIGVEIGQIGVLLVAVLIATWLRRRLAATRSPETAYRRVLVLPASLLIGSVGAFWTVERLLAV
jgi:hypothetical protein